MKRSACRYIENGKQLNQMIMAKVTDVFLRGTIGKVVFYLYMRTNCARKEGSVQGSRQSTSCSGLFENWKIKA